MLSLATSLEREAAINMKYAAEMERVAAEMGGRLGATNAPLTHAAHLAAAERKLAQAQALREKAGQ